MEHGPEGLEAVPYRFTGKELDEETGLYYYGARYLNPRTSRWISPDPMIEDYLPVRPVDKESREHNQNLPGMGGVFNIVNLAVYHYGGNNPIIFTDPTGLDDEVWTAISVEVSGQMIFAAPDTEASTGVLAGIAIVKFTSEKTGESFAAEYSFVMEDVGGVMLSLGVNIAEYGVLRESFAEGTSFEEVARSYQGIFNIVTGSVPVGPISLSGSYIRGKIHWSGGSVSFGAGLGGGIAAMRVNYRLLGIQQPGEPTPFDNLRNITYPF